MTPPVHWRIMQFRDFEVILLLEDEGGGVYDERNLGTAREDLFNVVPVACWADLRAMIDALRDAQEFYEACKCEQWYQY